MKIRDRQPLEDILEFSARAVRLVKDRPFVQLSDDEAVLYAVRYCLQVIGESAKALSDAARASVPAIPWPQIIAMRHRLVHGYGAITDEIVYNTVIEDLPVLIAAVEQALSADPE